MTGITTEIILILILILANGVFSMAESAVVASRKARLQQAAREGNSQAQAALELSESPNRFLATVQIGITLIGILSGAFGGATLSKSISAQIATVSYLAPYANGIGLGVVVMAITYLSLVVGELVPKRLALNSPERIASVVARPMRTLSWVASPVVFILSHSTDLVLRVFGLKASNEPPVTEEEIKVMIEQGTQAGVFASAEQDIVERVFRLGDRRVESLMTRRLDMDWLNLNDSWEVNQRKMAETIYSRLPVCQGHLDNIIGMVRAKDILNQCLEGQAIDLASSVQPAVFVPETMPALNLLNALKNGRAHSAIAVDEHGGTQGLVTLHDILSAIVGDLPVLDETDEPDAIKREDGSWLLNGTISIEEFKHIFALSKLPGEDTGKYTTLSGFIMSEIGRIPTSADRFESVGLSFEIVDMDGHHIDKVMVTSDTIAKPQPD